MGDRDSETEFRLLRESPVHKTSSSPSVKYRTNTVRYAEIYLVQYLVLFRLSIVNTVLPVRKTGPSRRRPSIFSPSCSAEKVRYHPFFMHVPESTETAQASKGRLDFVPSSFNEHKLFSPIGMPFAAALLLPSCW
jgi:hypothetical protein